jgi:hypothetical protein
VEGTRGPTHASIYHARSIRVYSNAVFPEIGSSKRILRHETSEKKDDWQETAYQLRGSNRGLQTWMHSTQKRCQNLLPVTMCASYILRSYDTNLPCLPPAEHAPEHLSRINKCQGEGY